MSTLDTRRGAFTLVELVVAIVILGLLAAMAIPRLSRGAVDGDEAELRSSLSVLRTAIELYYHDHGVYPGREPAGSAAAEPGTAAAFVRQLTRYTDAAGRVSATPGGSFCYGPYLRQGVPPCPVAPRSPSGGVWLVSGSAIPAYSEAAGNAGWVYNCDTGYVAANSPGVDAQGVRYDRY
jgi:prepilin-type N-terminal cleavage/methylation domain-containing protein